MPISCLINFSIILSAKFRWQFTIVLSSHTKSVLMLFPLPFLTPEDSAAFPFFILLIDTLSMSTSIERGMHAAKRICQKQGTITYKLRVQKLFQTILCLHHRLPVHHRHLCIAYQYCPEKPCNAFLIISQHNISKSVPFYFKFNLVNSPPSFFLCF